METKYWEAGRCLRKGSMLLAMSLYATVMNNKALSAFVVSFVVNISLFCALTQARVERDRMNHYATQVELENDSLSQKYIRMQK